LAHVERKGRHAKDCSKIADSRHAECYIRSVSSLLAAAEEMHAMSRL
jgi:hypothetical protein